MSDEIIRCAKCGNAISLEALQGICPACLLAMNLSAPTEEFGPEGTQVLGKTIPGPSIDELSKLFPQLEILEPLGRGGMGAVYKARHPKLDRLVALKILLRRDGDLGSDKAFAERFCREARALARLSHPGIVSVYDFGEVGGYSYLLMEYVDGLTLRQLLQRGKLQPEEALALVPRICDALQFAHKQGVIHRDIKPENILLDKAGQVKIADFGIAKLVDPGAGQPVLTGGKDVIGTPHYMAPEQIEQPAKVDHRADIFSLGVVLYEMLTGELPLGKFRPPSSKVTIDVRLDEIVLRALEKEPERRYQQISQVKTDVENVSTVSAGRSQATARADIQTSARERKSAAIAAGSTGLSAIFLLATATQVQHGFPTFFTLCGAAGLLTAAIFFARKAWDWPGTTGSEGASASQKRVLPTSLILLCVLMLIQGFYALLETVLRQQPGLVIFPTSFCVITGIGLLFLRRWARILALAWVWVSYVMYLVMGLLMIRARFPGSNLDLKTEIMGRGVEDPRYYAVAVLLFVSGAFLVPWTHWLLTKDHIKGLFGIEPGTSRAHRSQTWGFAIGATIILAAVLVWMAMPKRLGTMLSGKVTSADTKGPVQAKITVTGSKSRSWHTTSDRNGSYTIQVPLDAGFLYRDGQGEHHTEVVISAAADGFEPIEITLGNTRSISYYKRECDFQLQPHAGSKSSPDTPGASPLTHSWRRDDDTTASDILLLQLRRVLTDAETNANTRWLETIAPGEARLPVDNYIAVTAAHIEKATLSDEVFSTAGPIKGSTLGLMTKMSTAATPLFEQFTRTNIGRRIAVIIDGKIVSAPVIQSAIPGGLGQITGKLTLSEMLDLAASLNQLTRPIEHELVLPDPNLGQGVFDLDSRRYTGWPREVFDWNEGALDRWLESVGADLFTGVGSMDPADSTALAVQKMRMTPVAQDAWTNLPSRSEVIDALSATNIVAAAHLRPGPMLLAKPEPAAYAFCTAEGSVGVMQIVAKDGKVALAYKTLPPPQPRGGAPVGSGSASAPSSQAVNQSRPVEFKVVFTNGVKLEIVAIARNPRGTNLWWRPDGTSFQTPPVKILELPKLAPTTRPQITIVPASEFAFYIRRDMPPGVVIDSFQPRFTPRPSDVEPPVIVHDAQRGTKGYAELVCFPDSPESVDYHEAIACGPWEAVSVYEVSTKITRDLNQGIMALWSEPRYESGALRFDVMHNADRDQYALRMVARLRNGGSESMVFHTGVVTGSPAKGFALFHGNEANTRKWLLEVKELVIERSPWMRAEIKDIVLPLKSN